MKRCHLCGKKSMTGNSRSHSNIATKRKQTVNLQWKILDNQRVKLCTKCIKTGKKVAASQAS